MPNSQKEDKSNLTEEKKFNNEWEDSTLEQMMMEYSEE